MSQSPNKMQILSLPPNDRPYKPGDFKKACKLTPIPLFDIPTYLIKKEYVPGWRPPHVWCGWIGKKRMMDIVEKKFPDRVLRDQHGPMVVETTLQLPRMLCEALDIPKEYHDFIRVVDAARPDGKLEGALVVGDNYKGILSTDSYALYDITHDFFDGIEPNWFLDPYSWKWKSGKVIETFKPSKNKRQATQNAESKASGSSAA